MPTCPTCSTVIIRTDNTSISCCDCKKLYHRKCSGIVADAVNSVISTYRCSDCESIPNNADISDIIKKFNIMKHEISEVKLVVGKIEKQMSDVVTLGKAIIANTNNISALQAENRRLVKDVCRLDALSRQNNIVMTGIPESPNENLEKIFMKVSEKLNFSVKSESIVKICRFRAKFAKIKPILIVMSSLALKEELLVKFKTLKSTLTSASIGLTGSSKIHLGVHIGSFQQRLLNLAKQKLVNKGLFKYAWVQHGEVLLRKTATSGITKVKCEADIGKLEGHVT